MSTTRYSAILLGVLLLIFILNQSDRQLLPVLISGGLKCPVNNTLQGDDCIAFSSSLEGLLKGPTFTIVYSIGGVLLASLDSRLRKSRIISTATCFWSIVTCCLAWVSSYWHLVALRLLLGIGEAVFNPVALATIAAVFPFEQRARALSIFYTGVYLGGGFGYLAGAANTTLGWRNTFLLFGTPGIALGLLYLLVGRRADRIESAETDRSQAPKLGIFTALWRSQHRSTFLLLCLSSSIRNVAGYSLGAYTPTYFRNKFSLTDKEYGHTMALMGVVVAVSGTVGSNLGGWLSDRLASSSASAKLDVIALSQVLAAPCIFGVLSATSTSQALGLFSVAYITAETWLGPAACVVQDIVEPEYRAQASAVYIMLNTIVGGCGPLMVGAMLEAPSIARTKSPITTALLLVVPTTYLLSSFLFYLTGRQISRRAPEPRREYLEQAPLIGNDSESSV